METPKNNNIYITNINSETRKSHLYHCYWLYNQDIQQLINSSTFLGIFIRFKNKLQASNPSKTFSKCTNALSLKSAASSPIVPQFSNTQVLDRQKVKTETQLSPTCITNSFKVQTQMQQYPSTPRPGNQDQLMSRYKIEVYVCYSKRERERESVCVY